MHLEKISHLNEIPYKQYYNKISNHPPRFLDPIKDWSLLCYENYLSNEKN